MWGGGLPPSPPPPPPLFLGGGGAAPPPPPHKQREEAPSTHEWRQGGMGKRAAALPPQIAGGRVCRPPPHKKNIPKSKLGDLPVILLFLCQILSSIKGKLPYTVYVDGLNSVDELSLWMG